MDLIQNIYSCVYGILCCGFCSAEQTVDATAQVIEEMDRKARNTLPPPSRSSGTDSY